MAPAWHAGADSAPSACHLLSGCLRDPLPSAPSQGNAQGKLSPAHGQVGQFQNTTLLIPEKRFLLKSVSRSHWEGESA